MKVSDYTGGNYLTKADLDGREYALTVDHVAEEQLRDSESGGTERKAVMYFRGAEKGLVLNATNMNRLVPHYGDDMSLWGGARVVLYHDPNVEMRGKVVGGLRLRVDTAAPAAAVSQPGPAVQQSLPGNPQRPTPSNPPNDDGEAPF